jgi:diguanylate cyclase (GGDEF)-like protein
MVHPDHPMTASFGGATESAVPGRPDDAPCSPQPASAFEAVQAQGYAGLRFPPELEARFLADKSAERLRLYQLGALLLILLSNVMLFADWLMIPDQFNAALALRLGLFTPLCLLLLMGLKHMNRITREWSGVVLSAVAAMTTSYLCLSSTDPLATPYLVCLSLIQLFNGGVMRIRFWLALRVDIIVLVIYAATLCLARDPLWAIMISLSLVVVSTSVFTLYSSYWLEHEERSNWLMLQQEQVLLGELAQANQRLDQIARFDGLTELANRRHFDEFLAQLWGRARQDGQELALLIIDIDHFKQYNDHYGHLAGDDCLKEVAASLKRHLRKPEDMLARMGGEEFIAVLSRTTLSEALAVAERVRDGVAHIALPHATSPVEHHVTVSIGVAGLRPQGGTSAAQLVASADAALYQAKAAGRNRVCAAAAHLTGSAAT